jgi:hypothetical protein
MKYTSNNPGRGGRTQKAVVPPSGSFTMSYLAIASGCDLVSFVWTRANTPAPQPRPTANTFRLAEGWQPIRLVIELGNAASAESMEQDPERWDGLA